MLKKMTSKIFSTWLMLAVSCSFGVDHQDWFERITPRPVKITTQQKDFFVFNQATSVSYIHPQVKPLAQRLAQRLGITKIIVGENENNSIFLDITVTAKKNDESYDLVVTKQKIHLIAQNLRGLNWGVQTLLQMLPAENFVKISDPNKKIISQSWQVPACMIEDEPRFSYRGMHLDVCRHFFSVEEVKLFLDWMATYKLNTFHWHLTDDQGWRIEIKKYPKLIEFGAKRSGSPQKGNRNQFDNQPYGPFFYTQEQIKEIIAYAQERGIEIIPEIEMPGHAQAALSAYAEFGCTGGPYQPWTKWGVSDHVFCAGNEKVYTFLQDIIDEVIALFPGKYIHVGGDECPKSQWQNCPKCQKLAQQKGLKINELQGYLMTCMVKYIENKGRHVIGWDELLDDGEIPKASKIMAWRGVVQGKRATARGFQTVMTPNEYLYFDYAQSKSAGEPETIGGLCSLEGLYAFDPTAGIEKKELIVGLQANCWSEYFFDFSCVEYAILPRIAALSEVAWSKQEQRFFDRFVKSLPYHLLRFDYAGANYRCVAFNLGETLQFEKEFVVDLEFIGGLRCLMTSDGTLPSSTNCISVKQKTFTEDAILKYYFQMPSGKKSQIFTTQIKKLVPQQAIFENKPENAQKGLLYQANPGRFRQVSDLNENETLPWQITEELTSQLPGVPKNMIGLIFEGYFEVKEAGIILVENSSDDGSVIWVNGQKIIDNDGLHGAAELIKSRMALEKGWHKIKVKYFDAGGGASMNYRFFSNGQPIKLNFIHLK